MSSGSFCPLSINDLEDSFVEEEGILEVQSEGGEYRGIRMINRKRNEGEYV